jgi:hypothetical protein
MSGVEEMDTKGGVPGEEFEEIREQVCYCVSGRCGHGCDDGIFVVHPFLFMSYTNTYTINTAL